MVRVAASIATLVGGMLVFCFSLYGFNEVITGPLDWETLGGFAAINGFIYLTSYAAKAIPKVVT